MVGIQIALVQFLILALFRSIALTSSLRLVFSLQEAFGENYIKNINESLRGPKLLNPADSCDFLIEGRESYLREETLSQVIRG